jgi:hypothetical protein
MEPLVRVVSLPPSSKDPAAFDPKNLAIQLADGSTVANNVPVNLDIERN